MDYILQTQELSKRYKHKAAVKSVSMNIKPCDIYGFLGQNGAGKTTTMRMIMGLIKPMSGSVDLFGQRGTPYKKIGSMIEYPGFYPNLTGKDTFYISRVLL